MAAWAGVLAWAPRRLAPGPGLPTSWTAAAAWLALGGGAFALGPPTASERLELALLVQTAAALAAFDLRWLLIPDLYTAAFGLAGAAGPLSPGLPAAAAGALLGGGLLGGVRWAAGRRLGEEAMGFGDVKLGAALGALLGPLPLLWAIAAAAGLGAAAGLVRRRPGLRLPLGAFLAPVGVAVLWAGLA